MVYLVEPRKLNLRCKIRFFELKLVEERIIYTVQTNQEAYRHFLNLFVETTEEIVYDLGQIEFGPLFRHLPSQRKKIFDLVQQSIKTYQSLFRDIRQDFLFSQALTTDGAQALDLIKDTIFLMKGSLLANLAMGAHLLMEWYPQEAVLRLVNAHAKQLGFIVSLIVQIIDVEESVHYGRQTAVSLLPILQTPGAYNQPYAIQISGDGVLHHVRAKQKDLEVIFSKIFWCLARQFPQNYIWVDSDVEEANVRLEIWNTAVALKDATINKYTDLIEAPSLFHAPKINGVTLPLAIGYKYLQHNKGTLTVEADIPTKIIVSLPIA